MNRRGFTLVELLVAIAIMLVMLSLASVAASAARTSARTNATRALIERLDAVLSRHLANVESANVPLSKTVLQTAGMPAAAYRSLEIRRTLISGDLPDNWADVQLLASGLVSFTLTPPQRAYAQIFSSSTPTAQFADAECLFMIVMRGGIADCLDCGALSSSAIGDRDNDGAPEFLDAWGEPIRYVLWPAGLRLPATSTEPFFAARFQAPFSGSPSPTLGMRPLIFSGGADKKASLAINVGSYIQLGNDCGNWQNSSIATLGSFFPESGNSSDYRADNITNLDDEMQR